MVNKTTTTIAILTLFVSAPAAAQDLGNALQYIEDNFGEEGVAGYESLVEPQRHEALAMLTARDVQVGKDLTEYDCWDSPIDGGGTVMRTSGEQGWATRACHEYKFRQDEVPGFRTVGDRILTEREVMAMIEGPAARQRIPPIMLLTMIRFASGFRPGAISNEGHKGLLQLREDNLAAVGIHDHGDLLDPVNNIEVGAEYYVRLTIKTGGYFGALMSWHEGLNTLVKEGWNSVDKRNLYWVREVDRFYFSEGRSHRFPTDIAASSMTFVWTWMD